MPRLLPLVGIAIGGVLAVKGLTEAPRLYLATQALAEDVVKPGASDKPAVSPTASILSGNDAAARAGKTPPAICAPTAAELAKEAGLSPAELQVLQSLSDRRGQLDQREASLDTQVELISAAENKLDSRIQEMNGLKAQIQGLLGQADQQQQADAQRLVRVYEDMPEKKAAAALTVMDDSVRLPITANMKDRKLAAVLAQMAPADAKSLTEKLAARTSGAKVLADAKTALNPQAATTPPANGSQTAQGKTPPGQGAQGQPAQGQEAQDQSADASGATAATPKPATKPHKVARAKPKPKPKAVDASAQASVAPKKSAKPAAPGPNAPAAPVPAKSVVPPVPPSASPG